MVGAGGIRCEHLKTLALSGFSDIHIIDLDTCVQQSKQTIFISEESCRTVKSPCCSGCCSEI